MTTTDVTTTTQRDRTQRDGLLVLGLGSALVFGVLSRGGFPTGDAVTVLLLVAVAAVARARVRREVPRPVAVCVAALLGLAVWSVGLALRHGDAAGGVPAAALLCGLAASAWTASGLDAAGRRVLHAVVLTCGVVVAGTGWAGVALHVEPLALVSSGLWRASSTLTYANAAAAFLVLALLLAVTVLPARRRTTLVTVSVLLLGLVATMSRAGLVTLGVGVLVLLASGPHRARLRPLWPVLPAVAVAAAGLLPALPAAAGPQPLAAPAGLACGTGILLLRRRVAVVLVVAAAATVVLAVPASTLTGIASTRLSTTSAERDDLRRVTAEQFLAAPLTGTGPGRLDLVYLDHTGTLVQAQYTHDEYLQTAAETGVVGLGLAVAALGALAAGAVRRWRTAAGPPVLALLAAFAVHSTADFLWHIPVLPLLLVVCAVSHPAPPMEEP
ncbi:O-antigen ligase family protein [Pseudonocardia sp. KRD-184]|uniref:O-antigen ligase family protein n=1 Tax=Pseudonocardia oceani TaxID=2792013 RepID=A0ABS6U6Q2_9PSEU|nr:O-antigen ligase family protein [Pseudonocardia oceani]MBW0089004.1 O-antigen ligase family protein [Pseudonocardia oceani]MBW0094899.1 O-antigen ligase family protein [Pseudonocardia oceani]MBW0108696.1 O-antigen ligase family protein [Pseudonocardia oceani]MBW0120782.1 O-antigen ligase family protein [Pseudonocardia oceani]MBW0127663.1 O-antigen ligase family protein [Pseudonocardia oceani]